MWYNDLESHGLRKVKFLKERNEKIMFSWVVKCSLDSCFELVAL